MCKRGIDHRSLKCMHNTISRWWKILSGKYNTKLPNCLKYSISPEISPRHSPPPSNPPSPLFWTVFFRGPFFFIWKEHKIGNFEFNWSLWPAWTDQTQKWQVRYRNYLNTGHKGLNSPQFMVGEGSCEFASDLWVYFIQLSIIFWVSKLRFDSQCVYFEGTVV